MVKSITIQNTRYYKPFDNSDNPCCWQLELLSEDIDDILSAAGIEYDSTSEDFGDSYSWTNSEGIDHVFSIECKDVELALYELNYWATKRKFFGLRRVEAIALSDFEEILPALLLLNQKA